MDFTAISSLTKITKHPLLCLFSQIVSITHKLVHRDISYSLIAYFFQDLRDFAARSLDLTLSATSPIKAGSSSAKTAAAPNISSPAACSGGGIVYCRTRDGCQSLADRLSSKGIKARAYHAGLSLLQYMTVHSGRTGW